MAEKGGSVSGVSGGSSYRSRRAECFSDRFAPLPDIIPLLVSLLFRSASFLLLFPGFVSIPLNYCSIIILYRAIFASQKNTHKMCTIKCIHDHSCKHTFEIFLRKKKKKVRKN